MLLPEPRRRGEIKFLIAKTLPYNLRLGLIFAFLTLGFALQFVGELWIGAVSLLAATLLSLVHGYSNIPEKRKGKKEWRPADRDKLQQILQINRKAKTWDQSFIDITCGRGLLTLLVLVLVIAWLSHEMLVHHVVYLKLMLVVDAVVLLAPHWITGVRRILTNPPLIIKIEQFVQTWDVWQKDRREDETLQAQLEVMTGPQGEIPQDAKLIVSANAASRDFLGLQVQISINNVQGSDYPYFYCVLVARRGFKLLDRYDHLPATDRAWPDKVLIERSHEKGDDVDVIVIRQETTKTSGYHTKPAACETIFSFALRLMREILAAPAQ